MKWLKNIEIDKQKKEEQRLNEEEHKLNYQKQKLEEIEQNIKKIDIVRLREKEIQILKEAEELREKEKQFRLKEQLEIEELKELKEEGESKGKREEELQLKEEEITLKNLREQKIIEARIIEENRNKKTFGLKDWEKKFDKEQIKLQELIDKKV